MYITFEGAEATGKSTQSRLLAEQLESKGHSVLLTREPGSPLDGTCRSIRELLLDKTKVITERSSLFLFLADRAQHIKQVILPALAEGKIVISDRSSLSTLVYYLASKPKMWDFSDIRKDVMANLLSTAQIVPPDVCFVARGASSFSEKQLDERERDRIESKGERFHESVRAHFDWFGWFDYPCPEFWRNQKFFPRYIIGLPRIPENTKESVAEFTKLVVEARMEKKLPIAHPEWKKEFTELSLRPRKIKAQTDIHTNYCCRDCGCKYNDDDCTVVNGNLEQELPCGSMYACPEWSDHYFED